jgi:hypothetical protein
MATLIDVEIERWTVTAECFMERYLSVSWTSETNPHGVALTDLYSG